MFWCGKGLYWDVLVNTIIYQADGPGLNPYWFIYVWRLHVTPILHTWVFFNQFSFLLLSQSMLQRVIGDPELSFKSECEYVCVWPSNGQGNSPG